MAATKDRKHAGRGTHITRTPAKFDPIAIASEIYYQGTLVGKDMDASGKPAKPMAADLSLHVLGVVQKQIDNSAGAQGDIRVPILAESAMMENDTALNAVSEDHLFGPVFSVDDEIVANNDKAATLPVAGFLVDMDPTTGKPVIYPNPVLVKMFLMANRPFYSAELTGTGASQDVAHGLGVIPGRVLVEPTDLTPATAGSYAVVKGAHDATNVKVTVTTGKKFRVWAWR